MMKNQQLLAAYEQKVLFLLDRQRGARRKQLCLYARSTRSGGYPYPAAAYVCGLPESANLMNAYLLVLERP